MSLVDSTDTAGSPSRAPTLKDWLEGARLRTLPAAAAPVLVGAGAALHLGAFSAGKSMLALLVALLLQIGVNFANDYSDGIRGTDQNRVGPTRLTASGLVPPRRVLIIALSCLGIAALVGLALVLWAQTWWLLLVGVGAVLAAWFYTGGKKPYGYMGFGFSELMVFVFFGLVATIGTAWVQTYSAPNWLWFGASGMGLASVALLLVNNIRDIPTDKLVGKNTLPVRLGDRWSRALFILVMIASATCGAITVGACSQWFAAGVGLLLAVGMFPSVLPVLCGASGHQLLRVLQNCGFFTLAYGVLVAGALAFC